MAQVTWKGEDELHVNLENGSGAGPSFTKAFGGIKFPKGEPVEITDPDFIRRAKGNPFFTVDGDTEPKRPVGRPPKLSV